MAWKITITIFEYCILNLIFLATLKPKLLYAFIIYKLNIHY